MKEVIFINPIKSSTKIAPTGSRSLGFPYRNLSAIDLVKNKLARDPDLVEGLQSDSTSFALSCNSTLDPALIPTMIPAPAPILVPTNEFFQQFMRVYLELNQGPR